MKQGELAALVDGIAPVITRLMADAYSKIDERMKTVEARVAAIPVPLKGDPGKDADPNEVARVVINGLDPNVLFSSDAAKGLLAKLQAEISSEVQLELPLRIDPVVQAHVDRVVAALPKPIDGKDAEVTDEQLATAVQKYLQLNPIRVPQDGKSISVDDVLPLLTNELAKAVAAIPEPENGKDGRNAYEIAVSLGFEGDVYKWLESMRGPPGIAVDGKSVTAEEVLPELKAELHKAIAAIPLPKDGKDSKVTAEDFRALFEAEIAKALLDIERRNRDVIDKAIDRIEKPEDGKPGRDCIDLGTFDIEVQDDFRTWRVSAKAGEQVVERTIHVPVPVFQGVWKSGDEYKRGDIVSFGGSAFIARRDTTSRPETDDSFQLFVKRGRDGKDVAKVERANPEPIRLR